METHLPLTRHRYAPTRIPDLAGHGTPPDDEAATWTEPQPGRALFAAAERSDPRRGTSPSRAAVERCHLRLVPIRETPPRWTTPRELASSPPRATATPRSSTAYPFDPTDYSRSVTRFSPNSPPIRPWCSFRRTSSTSTTPAARASRSPVPGQRRPRRRKRFGPPLFLPFGIGRQGETRPTRRRVQARRPRRHRSSHVDHRARRLGE